MSPMVEHRHHLGREAGTRLELTDASWLCPVLILFPEYPYHQQFSRSKNRGVDSCLRNKGVFIN